MCIGHAYVHSIALHFNSLLMYSDRLRWYKQHQLITPLLNQLATRSTGKKNGWMGNNRYQRQEWSMEEHLEAYSRSAFDSSVFLFRIYAYMTNILLSISYIVHKRKKTSKKQKNADMRRGIKKGLPIPLSNVIFHHFRSKSPSLRRHKCTLAVNSASDSLSTQNNLCIFNM